MNEPRRRGPIVRLAVGLWDAINFSRRLVLNLLFLLVLAIVLLAMFGGGKLAPLEQRSTLVFAPEGRLVEQYSCDAFSRNLARATDSGDCREVRLRDVLRALDAARTDKRIDFVGGIRGLAELEKRVNAGEMAVAFALFPTTLDQLMAVADAGEVMPPKSTWFEPKLADGFVSHVLD